MWRILALAVALCCGGCERAEPSRFTFAGIDMCPRGGIEWDSQSTTNAVQLEKPFFGMEAATLYQNEFNPNAAGWLVMEKTFSGKSAVAEFNSMSDELICGVCKETGVKCHKKHWGAIGAPLLWGTTNFSVRLEADLCKRLRLTVWTTDYLNSKTRQERYEAGELLAYDLLGRAAKRMSSPNAWSKGDVEVAMLEMLTVLSHAGMRRGNEYRTLEALDFWYRVCSAVDELPSDDDDLYLSAYILCEAFPLTWTSRTIESGRIALKKIVTARQSNGLWKNWTRTGLAALAIWNSKDYGKDKDIGMGDYGDFLESVVQTVKAELRVEKLTDDAAAISGMILMLTGNGNCEEVQKVGQMMDGWHFDDKRPDFVNYCATMFTYMRAYAQGSDETSKARWHAWYDEIRRMSQRTTVTGENEEHCLWVALNVLVKRQQLYWMGGRRSLPGYGKRSKVDNLIIDVDVDI